VSSSITKNDLEVVEYTPAGSRDSGAEGGRMREHQAEGHTRLAHRVAGPTVVPAPWPGVWLATWTQPGADPDAWCECPWEFWLLGAHVCNASKRLLDTWQVADAPALRAAQRRR
jgi:hypothetical protein